MNHMRRAEALRSILASGDRRSIGRVEEVVHLVLADHQLISPLMACLVDADTRICMRAADALEKISRICAELLQPAKLEILDLLANSRQQEVRWHLAVLVPRLILTQAECRQTALILRCYLEDPSSIVKTLAMQGLADLEKQYPELRGELLQLLRLLKKEGTPAMRARGRKLLTQIERVF